MKKIFISFGHGDGDFASQLGRSFAKQGISYHLSGHELHTGSDWPEGLKDDVKSADGFVLVMPETAAASSNNVFFEAGVARAFGKKVAVVVPDMQNVDQSNIPFDLAQAVVVDAKNQSLESVAATLLQAVDS